MPSKNGREKHIGPSTVQSSVSGMSNHMRWTFLLLTLCLPGCMEGKSIGTYSGDDRVLILDAKERVVTYMEAEQAPGERRIRPKRIVCAEPSPDVAAATSDSLKTSLTAYIKKIGAGEGGLGTEFGRTIIENIAQLGARATTTQLLRDELSDLCRAYANGAVSSITYTLRLSRLDKKMITLLLGETHAGALSQMPGRRSGTVLTSGNVTNKEMLNQVEQRISEATEAVSDASKSLQVAVQNQNEQTDPEKIKTADTTVSEAKELVHRRQAELSDRMLEKWALETPGPGLLAATNARPTFPTSSQRLSSVDLIEIQRNFLEDDDVGTLVDACLTSLEENQQVLDDTDKEKLKKLQKLIAEKNKEKIDYQHELNLAKKAHKNEPENKKRGRQDYSRLPENLPVKRINLEIEFLIQETEELLASRSKLARYCRTNGMKNIFRFFNTKIENKLTLEREAMLADICKVAIKEKAETLISNCAQQLFPTSENK